MSFSRAKVQRFNDIQDYTPSPADYNPVQKNRNGSVVSTITTIDKFSDNASVTSNDSSCFRTPNLIRKKKPPAPVSTSKKLFKSNNTEILQEKIVECNNKDSYIKDLTEQLEDLKTQLAELNKQNADLELEKERYETNLNITKTRQKSDIKKLASTHADKMNLLKVTLKQRSFELATLKEEYISMKEHHKASFEGLLKDINQMGEVFNVKVTKVYADEIQSREDKLKEKQLEIDKINEKLAELKEKNASDLEDLRRQHKNEISQIEVQMLEIITNSENTLHEQKKQLLEVENAYNVEMKELQNSHSISIASLAKQNQLEIAHLEENYQLMKDEIERETTQRIEETKAIWKNKLKAQEDKSNEKLRIFQQESESKIIDIELEKNKLKQVLADLNVELDILKGEGDITQKYKQLQLDYKQQIYTLRSKCDQLEQKKSTLENELAESITKSRAYEVTLQKTRETVATISKRLLDSDNDVEKLKREINNCEERKLNLEAECNKYQSKIEVLVQLNADLEEKQEKVVGIYKRELQAVKKDLENKTQSYKNLIDETTRKNEDLLKQTQSQLNETKGNLNLQQKFNNEAQVLIEKANVNIFTLEKTNGKLKEELDKLTEELKEKKEIIFTLNAEKERLVEQLQKEVVSNEKLKKRLENGEQTNVHILQNEVLIWQEKCENSRHYSEYYKSKVDEYEKEIEDTKKIQKNYNEQTKKYEELLSRFLMVEKENAKLEERLKKCEVLIGPYREQLEAFEYERKVLLSQKSDAEAEAAVMSAKYVDILGHQNQKQKIKHMVSLKEKNKELSKANVELEVKIRSQAKTIEKLKRELSKTPKKLLINDKENVNSPSKFLSPLCDRN